MRLWERLKNAVFGVKPAPKSPPLHRSRKSRAAASFEKSVTEGDILRVLAVIEPATVQMVREQLPRTTTVAQALPQMWKRGIVHRRRESGRNAYWYARSVEAFRPMPTERVLTDDETRRRRACELITPVKDVR